jgi:hypothetical protein
MNSSYNVGIPQLRRIHQFAFAFEFEFIKRKPRRRFAFAFKVPALVSSIGFLSAAQAFLFLASHDTSDQRAQDFVEWFRLLRIPSPHAHFQSRDTQSQRVGFLVDSLIQVTAMLVWPRALASPNLPVCKESCFCMALSIRPACRPGQPRVPDTQLSPRGQFLGRTLFRYGFEYCACHVGQVARVLLASRHNRQSES